MFCKKQFIYITALVLLLFVLIYAINFYTIKLNNILIDIINGLFCISFMILIFFRVNNIHKKEDMYKLKCMSKKQMLISANILFVLSIIGTIAYYYFRALRGDYINKADTIDIPIYYQTIFILILILPVNIFIVLSCLKINLNTNILQRIAIQFTWKQKIHILCLDLIIAICIACVLDSIILGDCIAILVESGFIYIILSIRSGKIEYYRN